MKKILLLLVFSHVIGLAQKGYPIPPDADERLFYIQHSDNHNTFVYDVNFSENNKVNDIEPIRIYRIAYTKGGVKEELSSMQRKFAYGITFKKIKESHYEFTLVAYPEKKLYLELDSKGKPQVKTIVNGKKMIVRRMFITKSATKSVKPKIDFIDFYGNNEIGNGEMKERFYL
ncbi:hypothetical protein FSS13T_20780 [Flavobacterium saliperosum S13]|uniref:DUF4833 domain-containing protein n=2 Tax=Flavobacterium saliperosum TaxID=329186 RepID=A0A1G4VR97_9FLAO|nr:DUF4833 domain-containing protein [Flavobacterium saliperosum]ESU24107.1 hypothetical protein FSS13T_20780 [Flavobacterium saliperosum S13]SCX10689.1 protein of unknown function [Flavobacterium saliperosum]